MRYVTRSATRLGTVGRSITTVALVSTAVWFELIGGLGVAGAGTPDQAFLDTLANAGMVWPPAERAGVIDLGHRICQDHLAGLDENQITSDIHGALTSNGFTVEQAYAVISAAESVYCYRDADGDGIPDVR